MAGTQTHLIHRADDGMIFHACRSKGRKEWNAKLASKDEAVLKYSAQHSGVAYGLGYTEQPGDVTCNSCKKTQYFADQVS